LRERLAVFESLFNNEGGAKMNNRVVPPAEGPKFDEVSVEEESRRAEEEEEDEEESERKIKSEKRSSDLVHELTQEVANLRLTKKALENKVRDVEIENMTLQQKFLPNNSYLKIRKPNVPPEASFNSHQYYQNLITRTKYNQKMLQDQNQSEILQGDIETNTTLPRDTSNITQDSVYQTPMRSKGDRVGTGYDQTRYSSVGSENRARTDENTGVVAIGSYLPKLRTEASDFNNNYHNGNAMNSSPSVAKKSTNVWLTGLFKKRANSTLRRIGTGNKLNEKTGYPGRTLEEIEKSTLSPRRIANK